MFVRMFTVGMLATNCFLVGDRETGDAVVIDPGIDHESEAKAIFGEVERNGLRIKYIINTHGHPDHSGGNRILKDRSEAPILIYEDDASFLSNPSADRKLRDGDWIEVGNVRLRVVHTPGHSPGSMALLAEDCVFSGDTLFAGSIGRYDLPGGSLKELVNSLKSKLLTLPDHVRVYPGHGPVTTIGEERRNNPFLKSFDWVVFG
jgi:glyoxylase-like metal-dependent hydrolase (beta-lactamase superfamily II)